MKYNAMLLTDFYKVCHKNMYPNNMTKLYSTWTPRGSRLPVDYTIWFGLQGFIKEYLVEYFNEMFFEQPLEKIISEYKNIISKTFDPNVDTTNIENLHNLGYLPIKITSISEGTIVPVRVPVMTIENTHPEFSWLTNYLETLFSCSLWQPSTSATISYIIRELIAGYLDETVGNTDLAKIMYGDFSFRGMSSLQCALTSGAGHMLSSIKTSTIPAIQYLCDYYNADINKEKIGEWSASTEHSCACSNYAIDGNEEDFFVKMATQIYPSGNFSFVSDSYDLWNFVANTIPKYKDMILNRDGKILVRPDSGIPELILCGDINAKTEYERKGLVEVLWDIFGGTITEKGYRTLDKHIGIIYGDGINYDRCKKILGLLKEKGFSALNIIYGIGSYTYNYNTRDTQMWALKATYGETKDKRFFIFKNPKTDNESFKKSQKGMCVVYRDNEGNMCFKDRLYPEDIEKYNDVNLLETVFINGKLVKEQSLSEIRNILHDNKF